MISKKFIAAIKLCPERQYRLAIKSGLHPSALSRFLCGIEKRMPDDPRIQKLAALVGVASSEMFDAESMENISNTNSPDENFRKRIDTATSQQELASIRKEIENTIGELTGEIKQEHAGFSLLLDEIEIRLQKI